MTTQVENRWHFGVPIFEAQLPGLKERREELKAAILAMRESDEAGIARSNQRGWHSKDDLHQTEDPTLKWVTEQIYQMGVQLIRHAEKAPQNAEIFLSSLWANVNDFGAWNAPHAHLPCEWSGCIYVDVNENPADEGTSTRPGDIMFFDPVPVGAPYRKSSTVSYTPKNGTLYLFPGYLMHMVAPHYEQDPRISMAFNFRLGDVIKSVAR